MEVLTEMRLARDDRVSGAAVQGDFEAAVTAVQCDRSAELGRSALQMKMWLLVVRGRSWWSKKGKAGDPMMAHVQQWERERERQNEERKIQENMKNTKEILRKMMENKKLKKKKVDKDNEAMNKNKEAMKKTMASKSKGKKKNKGKGRSKRE